MEITSKAENVLRAARRLYTEAIPSLIERERSTGKGFEAASAHLTTLSLIDAITFEELSDAYLRLNEAVLDHFRSKHWTSEEPSPAKTPLRTDAREECGQEPEENTVLLVGPQGVGKTLHASQLAAALGLKNILDEWNGRDRIPANTLALSNSPANTLAAQRVIEVSTTADLMALIGSPQPQDSSEPSTAAHTRPDAQLSPHLECTRLCRGE